MKIPSFLAILALLVAPLSMRAEAQRAVTLQTSEGSSIKGTVSGIREGAVSVITEFGIVRVPLDKLTPESRKLIEPSAEGEVASLKARVSELETLVERLREENAALRRQGPMPTPAPQRFTGGERAERVTPSAEQGTGSHWISNTGKRHNSRCRYFQTSAGRKGGPSEGVACKICGG